MPWKLILLDAENALSKGDARLAVILGQTAIEGAVEEFLIYSFRDKRPPIDDVSTTLGLKKEKILSYESAVQKASIHKKLSKGLQLAAANDLSTDAMCRATSIARHSQVYSSIITSIRKALPLAVHATTKS